MKSIGYFHILPDLASPVQSDILFISQERLDIIQEKFIEGVPELMIEVLSPSNAHHDLRLKYDLYAEAAVQEYWIVGPDICQVMFISCIAKMSMFLSAILLKVA